MPRLPGAQDVQQVGYARDPGLRVPAPISSGLEYVGAALTGLSKEAEQRQKENKEIDERREVDAAQIDVANAKSQFVQGYIQHAQDAKPGDMGIVDQYKKAMSDTFTEIAKGYSSGKAKDYVAQHGAVAIGEISNRLLEAQIKKTAADSVASHKLVMDEEEKQTATNPDLYDFFVGGRVFDIKNGVGKYSTLSEWQRDGMAQDVANKYAKAAATTIANDPNRRQQYMYLVPRKEMTDDELARGYRSMQAAGASEEELATYLARSRPGATAKVGAAVREFTGKEESPSWFKALDAGQRAWFVNKLEVEERQDRQIANHELVNRIKRDEAYIVANGGPPPNTIPVSMFPDNESRESYGSMIQAASSLQTAKNLPVQDAISMIDRLNPGTDQSQPGYVQKVREWNDAKRQYEHWYRDAAKDPVQAYSGAGGRIAPIDASNPKEWAGSLTQSLASRKVASENLGVPFTPLSKAESSGMGKVFSMLSAPEQKEVIASMAQSFKSDRRTLDSFYSQISAGSSWIEAVGKLSMRQDSIKRDQTIDHILMGARLMRPPSGKGEKDEAKSARAGLPDASNAQRIIEGMTEFKGEISPEFRASLPAYLETVMAHYVGKNSARTNLSIGIKDYDNQKLFEQSIKEVIGKPVKFGESKVIPPWGMDEADFINKANANASGELGKRMSQTGYGLRNTREFGRYEILLGGVATNKFIDIDQPAKEMPVMVKKPIELSDESLITRNLRESKFGKMIDVSPTYTTSPVAEPEKRSPKTWRLPISGGGMETR